MAVFQEGPGGRIITMTVPSQIDAMRRNILAGTNPISGDRVRWIEIPKDQESNYVNPAGFAIQGANSIYPGMFSSTGGIAPAGTDVAALAADLASRIDQTYGTEGLEGFGPPAATAISGDQQILESVMNGTIIETSQLAQIGDASIKARAADQLAKNIVMGLGATSPDAVTRLRDIYDQFIAGEGALDFNAWSAAAGVTSVGAGAATGSTRMYQTGTNFSVLVGAAELEQFKKDHPGYTDIDPSGVQTVTGKTTVYFNDGTNELVDDSELDAFVAANSDRGATTDRNRYPAASVIGAGEQFKKGAGQALQGTDKEIYDFLTGLYKKQIDTNASSPVLGMIEEAAETLLGKPGMFGQTFTDLASARAFLKDWTQNPLKGNFDTAAGWNAFSTAAMAMPPWTGTVTPTTYTGDDTPSGFDMGGLGPYGTWETLRPFSQIYPGFTSLLPGYGGSRAVQSAYGQAAAPLEMQYLAQQALTPYGVPGEEAVGSDVKSWLQNVQAGTQPLMMGQDYAGFLNQLAGVLGSPVGAMPTGMDPNVYSKMAGLFQDPAAQLEAFKNPFYRATAGAPQVRQALMDQIQQAAQRYQYQEPSGAFLPWAMEQNLAGIQGILPSLQGWGQGGP